MTLPAKKLFEIIKALPDTDVLIQEDKNGVKVAADRFESRHADHAAGRLPGDAGRRRRRRRATLPREITRQMVAKTQFAITGEDTRYFLNGALLVLRPNDMSMVATDGHRLALVTAPRERRPGRAGDRVILPKKTLLELGRLLGDGGDEVTFEKGENHLFFRVGGRVLDVADDRRPVPGLRARHPEEQRQARRVRSRSADQRGEARRAARRTNGRAR